MCSLLIHVVAEAPTQLTAVYKSVTTIFLEWIYTSSTQTITGYRYAVYYEYAEGSDRRNVFVSSGVNTYLLTGLPNGGVHSISIVAVRHLPSNVVGPIDPGLCCHNLQLSTHSNCVSCSC